MTYAEAAKAMAVEREHVKFCSRCRDISHGSCDRCYYGESLTKAADEAAAWVLKQTRRGTARP
jgi:hypothetical protein